MNSSADASRARLLDTVLFGFRLAESDVRGHRVAEQKAFLKDEADVSTQVLQFSLADIDAVDEHSARRHVIKASDQLEKRRLPRSGFTNDADALAGLDRRS